MEQTVNQTMPAALDRQFMPASDEDCVIKHPCIILSAVMRTIATISNIDIGMIT